MNRPNNYIHDGLRQYQKFVKIFGIRRGVFLEFEFTVGFKELTIELVMPYAAFKEFCETNHVNEIKCNHDINAAFTEMSKDNKPRIFDFNISNENERPKALSDLDGNDNEVKSGE